MKVFICLDDNGGMMFNNRRQSRDSAVISRIIEMSSGGRLLMNGYSAKLFGDSDIIVDEEFLERAEEGDFCFVENEELSRWSEKISVLIVFRWNRVYPADKKLDFSFEGKKCAEIFDFEGSSHENITCEVWEW